MSQNKLSLSASPSNTLKGELAIPGDKSISHRSIIFGSIADGITQVKGFLEGEDCLATLNAFRQMGVNIEYPGNGELIIHGVGINGLKNPTNPINLGNSGTSIRLLAGLLAGAGIQCELTGDESLNKRPMKRVVDPLTKMGALIDTDDNSTAPLKLHSDHVLSGIIYETPMASAQVKSCILLAGLYAKGKTTVIEPGITRDHTERMLQAFGYDIEKQDLQVSICGGERLTSTSIEVPGDISSSAFFIVAASIAKDACITIKNVGMNPTRIGVINIMRLMGANIELSNERVVGAEPVADLIVTSSQLNGIEIPQDQVSLAIDEFPAIFIAAACAKGKTVLRGAKELRVKESDRIQAMADGLNNLGINATSLDDGIIIEGGEIQGGEVDSFTDHRIAMSFVVASACSKGTIIIKDCENIATSFPSFIDTCQSLGINLQKI